MNARAPVSLLLVTVALSGALWLAGRLGAGQLAALAHQLPALGALAPVAYVGVLALAVCLAVPAAPLSVLGGALLGPVWGALATFVAEVLGACVTFGLSRTVGRGWVEARLTGRLAELDAGFRADALPWMLFVRWMPVLPDNLVNYGAGLSGVRFSTYVLAAAIGVAPGAVAYPYLGWAGTHATPTRLTWGLGALALLALLPVLARACRAWGRRAVDGAQGRGEAG
ncbi:MAG: TVP38/TMEM64 family protein [Candidatus Sericytochromatia bacterium]|nr:TVP38/TMEM64 family protein [Candidatus Sericytochromatia bacterium]